MKTGRDIFGKDDDSGGFEEAQKSLNEQYGEEMLKKPEYRRIGISLERLCRSLSNIEHSWQKTNRTYSMRELNSILQRQHEIEIEVESIGDMFFRGYLYERLDDLSTFRRSIAEEIRWDVEDKKSQEKYDAVPAKDVLQMPTIMPDEGILNLGPLAIQLPINALGEY